MSIVKSLVNMLFYAIGIFYVLFSITQYFFNIYYYVNFFNSISKSIINLI